MIPHLHLVIRAELQIQVAARFLCLSASLVTDAQRAGGYLMLRCHQSRQVGVGTIPLLILPCNNGLCQSNDPGFSKK